MSSLIKKQYLIGPGLQVPLSSRQEGAWQHPGRHGAGRAESSVSSSKGSQGTDCLPGSQEEGLKAHPIIYTLPSTRPHLLQQDHNPNSSQTVLFPGDKALKWGHS